ncbi:NAD(P)-binding protein [Clavulina sp. PMI_390]|nr:NAD(P)-binding protein [Clavulina sp. PMI_390]
MRSIRVLDGKTVDDIVESLPPEGMINLMERVFTQLVLATPARISIPSDNHDVLFMPSRISVAGGTGIKIVSVPKGKSADGLPATTLLMNEETGSVEAMINARQLTAVRNVAGSALATKLAGVSDPRTIVFFGAGAQITQHALLFLQLYPSVSRCYVVNRSINDRVEGLRKLINKRFSAVSIEAVLLEDSGKLKSSLENADIVITATSSTKALFDESWLNPSAHLNLIGSYTQEMREVTPALIEQASLIIVDSLKDCQREAGDLAGTPAERMTELGSICGKGEVYKRAPGKFTVFKSVGVGVQDVAIARLVLRRAEEKGLGSMIPFD